MKYLLITLLFIPSILSADWKFKNYEYYIPKVEVQAISASSLMAGDTLETERYKKLSRDKTSSTLENYTEVSKVRIETMSKTNSRGVTATYKRVIGTIPSDYNYDTKEENQKLINAEVSRLKAIDDKKLEDEAKSNLGL